MSKPAAELKQRIKESIDNYNNNRASWPPMLLRGEERLRIFDTWIKRQQLIVNLARGAEAITANDVVLLGDGSKHGLKKDEVSS